MESSMNGKVATQFKSGGHYICQKLVLVQNRYMEMRICFSSYIYFLLHLLRLRHHIWRD